MLIIQLLIYIGIFVWLLSPDHMHIVLSTKEGRKILYRAAGVVAVGHMLSVTGQMFILLLLNYLRAPSLLSSFAYSAVFVAFWLLEAEAFHRIQYKISIKRALLKPKSLKMWLLISLAAAAAFTVYNFMGGLTISYTVAKYSPGFVVSLLLKLRNIVFLLRLPDIFLTACYSVLYYRTLREVIRTAEWG